MPSRRHARAYPTFSVRLRTPGEGRGRPMGNERPPAGPSSGRAGGGDGTPAMTDFRADGTIMGPTGLTAVFGMGTGGAPPVWSPESRPAGGRAAPAATIAVGWSRRRHTEARAGRAHSLPEPNRSLVAGYFGIDGSRGAPDRPSRPGRGGRIGVVKRSAVRTGRLRRSPAVHARPIDLVVFQEPSHPSGAGNLV